MISASGVGRWRQIMNKGIVMFCGCVFMSLLWFVGMRFGG